MDEMLELIKEFLSEKIFAVVGSFKNKEKVAYKILHNLISRGYIVYPVNPNVKYVDNIKCYSSLKDIPDKIDVVNVVTPPEVTIKILNQCVELGIDKVWLQPGAENAEVLNFCHSHKIKVVYNTCIMLQKI
ncbi:MAG: CoA-binding protein [Endomicrobia bacterium]|nr:CoA-binding protein [Endomicrobiia bacterium]